MINTSSNIMKLIQCLFFICTMLFAPAVHAETITIAAAADLKFAMNEIVGSFNKSHPGDKVEIVYGSSGKFFAQIQQGAPFDLFFSADIAYPLELAKIGLAASRVEKYAVGRIVIWSNSMDATKMTLTALTDPKITRIAIANPEHAPYGKRAEEALRSAGIWDAMLSRLVYGENIAQTTQFVQTGNAQIGIIALSLALNPELSKSGGYYLISDTLHKPLEQGYVITKRGADKALSKQLAQYIASKEARRIMTRFGFVLP